MAVSDIQTYTMLNAWQRRMRENIWRFNQIEDPGASNAQCPVYVQSDRDEIAEALAVAWDELATHLHYFPRPAWTTERIALGRNPIYELQQLRTTFGHLIALGSRATTLIDDAVTVTYSDADGDGINDTATVSVTTAVDTDEIQVFFRTADGAPAAADERYQIEPLTLSASGGTVTITGPMALFASPSALWAFEYESPNFVNPNAGSPSTAADFVTAVDVYQVTTDPTGAVTLLSDRWPKDALTTNATGFDQTTAGAQIVDAELGLVRVRPTTCADCVGPPQYVDIAYYSGKALHNGRMDTALETALIRLANTYMPMELCSFCNATTRLWQDDNQPVPQSRDKLQSSPFGSLNGQVYAWRIVKSRILTRAMML